MKPIPTASLITPGWFPTSPVVAGHVEPVPRRVRAMLAGRTVIDTLAAQYVWEHPWYPQFYVPAADVDESVMALAVTTKRVTSADGPVDIHRFEWDAFDAWFEEDEEVFGHPRSPYVRVDAVRSTRPVHVHVDGVTLAKASSSVAVFETGLGPRWYLDRTGVVWDHLEAIELRTLCPYKGRTTGYWSAEVGGQRIDEVAWSYDFPVREVAAIAGLVAFDDAKVTIELG